MKAGEKSNAEAQRGGEAERTDRWPLVRLGDVCEVRAGADYKAVLAENGPYPIYGTGGEMGRASQWRCPANSVIVGRKGTLDNPMLITEPFWNIDTCFGVIPDESIEPKYLYRFCQNFDFYSLVPASGRPSTTSDAIRAITLPLPPLATQRAIVERLDSALARAGALEERFAAIAQNAELSFKASLNEEFAERTSGTGETSGTGGTGDSSCSRSSRSSSSPRDPSGPSPQWPMVRLGDVCEHFQYGTAQKSTPTGLVPVLRMGNLQDGRIDFSDLVYTSNEEDIKEYALQDGDLLFNRTNSSDKVGKVAIFHGQRNCIFAGYLVRFRPMGFDPDYVCYAMNTDDYRNWCRSVKKDAVNQSNISASKLANFALACPPLSVQRAIVSRLDAARKRADGIATLARQAAEAAANLRKALLKEAFE